MNKAIFLDRDGVINELLYEPDGNIMSPTNLEQLKIMPNVKEGILKMKKLGFKIIVVTNQPGICFGYLTKEKLNQINNYLKEKLKIDEIYSCIHHSKYTGECNCKKPKIGLILKAKEDFDLDISSSYMVGDNLSDIEMGNNAKVKKTFRVGIPRVDIMELQHKKNIFPDYTLPNLLQVSKKIDEIESFNLSL